MEVSIEIAKLLDEYSEEVKAVTEDEIKKTSKEAAKKLRDTSPKGPRGYAKSWKVKKNKGATVVYNDEHYRLTHLLENGHVIKNQYGTYGRTTPIKHIKPVEEWAQDELPKRIEEALK